jgi:hypothetical protein
VQQLLNDGWHDATSSTMAALGRMATWSRQVVRCDDAVAKRPSEMPAKFVLGANSPQMPRGDGCPLPVL